MIDRLEEFVYGDSRARHSVDRTSIALSFIWYMAAAGFNLPNPLLQSIVFLFVCQTGATFFYCLQHPFFRGENTSVEPFRRMGLKAIGSFAAACVVSALSAPIIQAAFIDERLRRISRAPTVETLRTAAALLSSANSERLVLSRGVIERIVAHRLTLEDVAGTVTEKVNNEAAARGIKSPVLGLIVRKKTRIDQMFLDGISGEAIYIMAGTLSLLDGSLVPPDMVAFAAPIGSGLSRPTRKAAGFIQIDGADGHISIPIDGFHCKNVIFSDCTLKYSGGPIKLENTGFVNSRFAFSENLKCQQLAEQILSSPSLTFQI
jgi:hypothetical protein